MIDTPIDARVARRARHEVEDIARRVAREELHSRGTANHYHSCGDTPIGIYWGICGQR